MTDDEFWSLIARLDWGHAGDDDAVAVPVVTALVQLGEAAVLGFEEQLAAKLFALDTEAHAREIGEDAYTGEMAHFSVDWFLYARCVVVANGQDFYTRVLADPGEMPKDMEFEALLGIGPTAYKQLTSREYGHSTSVSYETFSNRAGWA